MNRVICVSSVISADPAPGWGVGPDAARPEAGAYLAEIELLDGSTQRVARGAAEQAAADARAAGRRAGYAPVQAGSRRSRKAPIPSAASAAPMFRTITSAANS